MLETKKKKNTNKTDRDVKKQFEEFIIENDHPCLMAQTVFKMDDVQLKTYDGLGTMATAHGLVDDIKSYIDNYDFSSNGFETFLAVFPSEKIGTELAFETLLWKQLRLLAEVDEWPWNRDVSSNPYSKDFRFSIAGKAFYIVGMHPNSSRKARQSPFPAMAFNLHDQFQQLRHMKVYTKVRDKIRERDKALQGNINPMLQDFGMDSEAKQYSGREVDASWACPFHTAK